MKLWLYITGMLLAFWAHGQSLTIRPEHESILLGERNVLHIALIEPINKNNLTDFTTIKAVKMSAKKDKDSIEVEILDLELDVNELRLTVTAWDSGVVILPPFAVDKSGKFVTEATSFRIEFPQVDEKGEILDIYETTFDLPLFDEFFDKYWWFIDAIILMLFTLGLFLIQREKDEIPEVIEPKIIIPSEEIALSALEALYKKQMYSSDIQKIHFATFSDILRTYISSRYGVVTFEKTTAELIHALRLNSVPIQHREFVEELLSIADMIKFSKATTDEIEMLRLKDLAINYINMSTVWYHSEANLEKGDQQNA